MFSLKTDLFKGIAHPASCASRGIYIYIYLFLCLAAGIAAYLTGILPHFSPLKDNLSFNKTGNSTIRTFPLATVLQRQGFGQIFKAFVQDTLKKNL